MSMPNQQMAVSSTQQENAVATASSSKPGPNTLPAVEARRPLAALRRDGRRAALASALPASFGLAGTIAAQVECLCRANACSMSAEAVPLGKLARQLQGQARRIESAVQHAATKAVHLRQAPGSLSTLTSALMSAMSLPAMTELLCLVMTHSSSDRVDARRVFPCKK